MASIMWGKTVPKTTKPPICEVLGVEVGEKFELENTGIVLFVNTDGKIHTALSDGTSEEADINVNYLVDAYNNNRIIPQPIFTEEEKTVVRLVKKVYPWANYIVRSIVGVYFTELTPKFTEMGNFNEKYTKRLLSVPEKLFPSLKPMQSASLEKIL